MLGCAMMSAQPAPGSFEQTWTRGPEWLRDGVIYQVYPSSYKDSDGNGIGDIRGVISELDYIESLGVRAIWFNPLFVSGWIDGGYDVIDFYRVDPRFGTNNDMVELIEKAHAKGIKVMLDWLQATLRTSTPGSSRVHRTRISSIPTIIYGLTACRMRRLREIWRQC